MVALIEGEKMVIYRRTDRGAVFWRKVTGSPEELRLALTAAVSVRESGLSAGEWRDPNCFALDPAKPIPVPRV